MTLSDSRRLSQLLMPARGLEWQERGLCRCVSDPDVFYPEKGSSAREAKRVCAVCPVREPCLEYALASNEAHGVWGGLSERDRRALRKQRANRKEVAGALAIVIALPPRALAAATGFLTCTRCRPGVTCPDCPRCHHGVTHKSAAVVIALCEDWQRSNATVGAEVSCACSHVRTYRLRLEARGVIGVYRDRRFGCRSLSAERVLEMRRRRAAGVSYRKLAAEFGIALSAARRAVTGVSYADVA